MTRRKVFLHVGVPGPGTTTLHRSLVTHREGLLTTGVLVAADSDEEAGRAVVELQRTHARHGLARTDVEGTWARLCRRIHQHRGTSVVTHPELGASGTESIDLALDGLAGLEVHVVLTTHHLGRQLVAGWEERLRGGGRTSFDSFSSRVLADSRTHRQARDFWAHQDLEAVLTRWGKYVPPERVHLLVAPHEDAPTASPWSLFAELVGVDPAALPPDQAGDPALGSAQLAVLRKVNQALDGRLDQAAYRQVAQRALLPLLARRLDALGPVLPTPLVPRVTSTARAWQDRIRSEGYDVRGDLDALLPPPSLGDLPAPDDSPRREQLVIATRTAADLVVALTQLQADHARLTEENLRLDRKRRQLKKRLRRGS